jgi:hypothetical protein
MPIQPRWHDRLPEIRRRIQARPKSKLLDRKAIENLFGVKARQANNLMQKFDGYEVGQSFAVSRSELLARIDEMSGPRGVAHAAIQQKISSDSFLNDPQQLIRPKKIPLPPPKPVGAPLPAGVSQFAPGKVLIDYTSSGELLSCCYAIVKSAVDDYARFDAALEYPPPRNGDCTAFNNTDSAKAPLPESTMGART